MQHDHEARPQQGLGQRPPVPRHDSGGEGPIRRQHLRRELAAIREAADQVAEGRLTAAAARADQPRDPEEHEVIAAMLDRFDQVLVAMLTDPAWVDDVRRFTDELGDALLSHLAYEADELLEPLGRSSVAV